MERHVDGIDRGWWRAEMHRRHRKNTPPGEYEQIASESEFDRAFDDWWEETATPWALRPPAAVGREPERGARAVGGRSSTPRRPRGGRLPHPAPRTEAERQRNYLRQRAYDRAVDKDIGAVIGGLVFIAILVFLLLDAV